MTRSSEQNKKDKTTPTKPATVSNGVKSTTPSPSRRNRFQTTEDTNAQNDVYMTMTQTGDLVFSCFSRRTGSPTYLRYHINQFETDTACRNMICNPKVDIHVFGYERDPPPALCGTAKTYVKKPDPRSADQTTRNVMNMLFVRFKTKDAEFDDEEIRNKVHRNFVLVMNHIGKQTDKSKGHEYPQTFRVGPVKTTAELQKLGDLVSPETLVRGLYYATVTDNDPMSMQERCAIMRADHDKMLPYFSDASYAQFLEHANLPVPAVYAQQLALAAVNGEAQQTNGFAAHDGSANQSVELIFE